MAATQAEAAGICWTEGSNWLERDIKPSKLTTYQFVLNHGFSAFQ
jgi:hypothetical protein